MSLLWRKPQNEQANLLDLLCAITSDNELMLASASAKRRCTVFPKSGLSLPGDKLNHNYKVSFCENLNVTYDVPAYSRYYGFLPQSYVATSIGWKRVSTRADHFAGKDDTIMADRRNINSRRRDHDFIDQFKRSMMRT